MTEPPGVLGPTPPPPPPPAPGPPREARWLPAVASLLVLLFVSFGGFLVAGSPSAATQEIGDPEEPGQPIEVGPGVTITVPPEWSVERSEGQPPSLRLSNGIGQMYIAVSPVSGDPIQQLQAYLDEVLRPQASQISTSDPQPVDLPSGNPAASFAYLGTFEGVSAPLEGEVAAVVAPSGTAIVVDGWAPEGQYVSVQDDVRSTVASAEVA